MRLARSFMKIRKSSCPSTDPYVTPDFTDAGPDVSPSTTTLWVLPLRKDCIHPYRLPSMPQLSHFPRSRLWAMVSKDLAKSRSSKAAVVHHFCEIMACQYELSLAGASFAEAMLCIFKRNYCRIETRLKILLNIP